MNERILRSNLCVRRPKLGGKSARLLHPQHQLVHLMLPNVQVNVLQCRKSALEFYKIVAVEL